jgi:hypothetical protein
LTGKGKEGMNILLAGDRRKTKISLDKSIIIFIIEYWDILLFEN